VDRLDAVMIQPSTIAGAVALFRFHKGELAGPLTFVVEAEDPAQSTDKRAQTELDSLGRRDIAPAQRFSEELAILKRWYYRTHKVGEIVLARADGELSIRKVVNAVGRVLRGEKQPVAAPESNETMA
jgi:hypothetical protein